MHPTEIFVLQRMWNRFLCCVRYDILMEGCHGAPAVLGPPSLALLILSQGGRDVLTLTFTRITKKDIHHGDSALCAEQPLWCRRPVFPHSKTVIQAARCKLRARGNRSQYIESWWTIRCQSWPIATLTLAMLSVLVDIALQRLLGSALCSVGPALHRDQRNDSQQGLPGSSAA